MIQPDHFPEDNRELSASLMMPFFSQKATIALDLNALALSVINLCGQPNLLKILSSINSIITLSVAFLVGMASTHFVKKYVAVKNPMMLS